jgi:hypothetical protein
MTRFGEVGELLDAMAGESQPPSVTGLSVP